MSAHKTVIEHWASNGRREVEGQAPAFVRWNCTMCGRIGNAIKIGSISRGKTAEQRASEGGLRHVAAMERDGGGR